MKRIRWRYLLILASTLLLGSTLAFAEAPQDSRTILASFLNPDFHVKPMTRLWFPDAAAGEDNNETIEKQILELADKGFGGVEVAMLMTFGVFYTNEESRSYGWGTENWIKLLKKVLKAAAKVPGGFEVDMTVTE